MEKRKLGRPKASSSLDWRFAIRLTQERGEKLQRLAAREELPVATVARRLLSERLDEITDE